MEIECVFFPLEVIPGWCSVFSINVIVLLDSQLTLTSGHADKCVTDCKSFADSRCVTRERLQPDKSSRSTLCVCLTA